MSTMSTTATSTDLDAALTAASAGPNPPPLDRLRAAAEYVIERAGPDQLILFGSASRGEFRDGSDFDFLVLGDWSDADSDRWTHPVTHDEIDLVFEKTAEVAIHRWQAGTVQAVVFAEGATVFTAPRRTTVPTLRDEGISPEECMREGKYELDKAVDMKNRATTAMKNADNCVDTPGEEDWHTGCQRLQECIEKGLKSLRIANNAVVHYTHEIGFLRDRAADVGERIDALNEVPDDTLKVLSKYGLGGGYDSAQGSEDPEKLFRDCRPVAVECTKYIGKRVPELLDTRDRERRAAQKAAVENAPLRPGHRVQGRLPADRTRGGGGGQ